MHLYLKLWPHIRLALEGNRVGIIYIIPDTTKFGNYNSSSSSVGATAHCGLWPVKKYLSIFSYLTPTLSISSLPALEDLFLLLLSIISWVFLFVSSLAVLE
jgi:hypothetical protein